MSQQGQQGYPPQGNFPQQGGYPQQGQFAPQGGQSYPPQGGQNFAPPGGYPQQGGGQQYSQQGGGQHYPQQGGQSYPQGGQGYPPQGGFPQQGGAAHPQQGGQGYPQGGFPQQQQQQQYGQQPYGQQGFAQNQPIVGPQYCSSHEQVFFLTEKLLSASGDDFSIKDANNPAHYYDLKSSALSMSGARVLKDSGGNVILNMKHKLMSGKLWYINRGANDKDVIAEVKKGASGPRQSVDIFFKGNSSHHFSTPRPDATAQGDVKGKAFTILRGQQLVAEISHKLAEESSKQRITGKDAYALRVLPGADAAFAIAIVLIVDELFND